MAYGVLSVLAGVVAIVWPGATLVVIAVVFALQLLVGAVYQFVFVFAIPHESLADLLRRDPDRPRLDAAVRGVAEQTDGLGNVA